MTVYLWIRCLLMCLELSALTEEKEIRQALPSFKPSDTLHYDHRITISWKALI